MFSPRVSCVRISALVQVPPSVALILLSTAQLYNSHVCRAWEDLGELLISSQIPYWDVTNSLPPVDNHWGICYLHRNRLCYHGGDVLLPVEKSGPSVQVRPFFLNLIQCPLKSNLRLNSRISTLIQFTLGSGLFTRYVLQKRLDGRTVLIFYSACSLAALFTVCDLRA